jgi:hypothetical protein
MKQIILVVLVMLLVACHSNPDPRVGQVLSSDYYSRDMVEETPDYIKYRVGSGWDLMYYVTCDKNDKIISVWSPK